MLIRACVLTALAALGGCNVGARAERLYSSKLPFDTPIDWWHDLQGGLIAEERPPPPGVGDPYPNLAEVPPKPTPTDAVTRRALAARLGTDRDRAALAAIQDPIPTLTPVAPPPPPKPPATTSNSSATPAPSATSGPADAPSAAPMATLEAADAPAPRPAPKLPPVPDAAPPPPSFAAAAAPVAPPRRPDPSSKFVDGPVPALPGAPPPAPNLPGIPAATFAPQVPKPQPTVQAAFLPNSAVMRPESDAALRDLATRRGTGDMALLGGGDAPSADAGVQAAALPLAWRRARAMADVLAAAGVPVSAMHIDAAALGRGGVVRLLN